MSYHFNKLNTIIEEIFKSGVNVSDIIMHLKTNEKPIIKLKNNDGIFEFKSKENLSFKELKLNIEEHFDLKQNGELYKELKLNRNKKAIFRISKANKQNVDIYMTFRLQRIIEKKFLKKYGLFLLKKRKNKINKINKENYKKTINDLILKGLINTTSF